MLRGEAPRQRHQLQPGLRLPAQQERLPRGAAVPALHHRLGPGPGPLLPRDLVHQLEPVLRLRPPRGRLPARQPEHQPAHLHRPPVLLRGPQGRAGGPAPPAPRRRADRHHDLQGLLLLLEHLRGEPRPHLRSLGGPAREQRAPEPPAAPHPGWWRRRRWNGLG